MVWAGAGAAGSGALMHSCDGDSGGGTSGGFEVRQPCRCPAKLPFPIWREDHKEHTHIRKLKPPQSCSPIPSTHKLLHSLLADALLKNHTEKEREPTV